MKHYSGIDYEHFLNDIRDMYPFSIDEAVLVELIANSLDAKTTLIDIRIDPEQKIFELTDNGRGMTARGFELYHNFSTSFKRKGYGIGFAGLGAKLALKISDKIVTETRQKSTSSKSFWGASEWKFEKPKRRSRTSAQPVWYDLDERTLTHHGTRVHVYLKGKSHALLKPGEVAAVIERHYLPLLRLHEFYDMAGIYKRITILINGVLFELPGYVPQKSKQFIMRRGKSRKPYGYALFELHPDELPEESQGIAVSTFGKVIKRDYLKLYFPQMNRVTGIIEVPELVECLTTNKCDFRKEGTAGNKYYRFGKLAQQEFRKWLEELQLLEKKEIKSDRDAQRLQHVINRIVGDIPDLQQFYGFRTTRESLVKEENGEYTGTIPEKFSGDEGTEQAQSEEDAVNDAIEKAVERIQGLEPGKELAAERRVRSTRFGPKIQYADEPDRDDISWMEGETVLINTAHPTFQKAVAKKVVEYHNLFAVAIAMLRDIPTATEKLQLLEQFMSRWGKV
jgi:hypothetical protein